MKVIQKKEKARKKGFTLLEVILVVAILVGLAAIVVPNLIGVQEGNKINQAKLQVTGLENAFGMYNIQTGNFPTSDQGINALITAPNPAPTGWRGPYLKSNPGLDPWGSPYNYEYPGKRTGTGGPDVWSNGPDRQGGTADDIGNWPSSTN